MKCDGWMEGHTQGQTDVKVKIEMYVGVAGQSFETHPLMKKKCTEKISR